MLKGLLPKDPIDSTLYIYHIPEDITMAAKRGLGRGINDLIPTDEPQSTDKKQKKGTGAKEKVVTKTVTKTLVKEVEKTLPLAEIEPNKDQPRRYFNEDALNELADSIKQFGVIEPIIVVKKGKYYAIIAGERRWRAARIAGVKEVPVIIRNYDQRQQVEIALIENLQRENLNPIEEARAYQRLIDEFSMKQDEVADRVSKGRTTITNSLRLLKLCDKVQQMVIEEMLTTGHARCLIQIEDPDVQYETAMTIFDRKMSVRETEAFVKQVLNALNNPKKADPESPENSRDLTPIYREIEEHLKDVLGTKATIKAKTKDRGKIEIEYYSADDMERILQRIYSIT